MTNVQSQPSVRTFRVPGISCAHCVAAITSEVGALEGVTEVEVDLDTKIVTVTGGDVVAIVTAIDEAGYDVVGD